MQRYRLQLAWLGTRYHGWLSHAPEVPSVCGSLQQAVRDFLGGSKPERRRVADDVLEQCSRLTGCSRTDAGVHATGAVAHLDLPLRSTGEAYSPHVVTEGLNHRLRRMRDDIQVLEAKPVADDFNARWTVAKRYVYHVAHNSLRDGNLLDRHTTWHLPMQLDMDALQDASEVFVGTHDFTSFRASGCQNHQPVKTITKCHVLPVSQPLLARHLPVEAGGGAEYFNIVVEGKGFLYRQVRKMVAALVLVGRRKWTRATVEEALAARDIRAAQLQAPPQGLVLAGVRYEDEPEFPSLVYT